MPNIGQRFGDAFPVRCELGPLRKFMDIHSPHLLRRLQPTIIARGKYPPQHLRRIRELISAFHPTVVNRHTVVWIEEFTYATLATRPHLLSLPDDGHAGATGKAGLRGYA